MSYKIYCHNCNFSTLWDNELENCIDEVEEAGGYYRNSGNSLCPDCKDENQLILEEDS